ncbi:NAD-dependent epimerase/dehydratase [Hydrogenophaga taeniospiralis CCUG 15921]|uniref:NAD-dependent epimerase/dehydratase n=1 Tax=Hydrogenophaga taeniospiralis CCUG 15921 TaxID=1281780 RepID=A0A9X4NW77_9BURK|nr:complex I NDUFA9 subunit family protein [Hydrogenophaga taeniospiralis]MDG5975600.1 NAD-dependent epimerase/dehydratase [Hydrogenophaga taeniospiralis CCUG 15921]
MKNILVLGGTGFVGRHVCEKLQRADGCVTVPTRRAANASAVQHLPRLTVIEADVHDEAQLARLLPGHDAVINLVAILHGSEAAFERTHVALPATLARACAATGVRRVVHVSALGVGLDAPSRYQRSKARGEQVLRQAGLDLTVLRPSVIFGAGDRFLNLFARLQAVFPVLPLAGAGVRFQPVWVEDVARAVVACALGTGPARHSVGQTYECAGPDVFTLADLVRLAGRLGSHQRPIVPLPMALGRLQALMMELAPGEPLMSRDNLDAMRVDNVATGQLPGLADLGIRPSSVVAVAPTYLGGGNGRSRLLTLRRG